MNQNLDRYSRQMRFAGIGEDGQRQLCASRVLLVGCGALGTVLADMLVRAGVGFLRIVDRDFVDLSNLQRQVLFDEQDVADHLPKAAVAATKLSRINSQVTLEPVVADVTPNNILSLTEGADLILDGTDNFETRFLINDAALEQNIPWIYGGVVGSHGQVLPIFPGETACLRCIIEAPPDPGMTETCDTAGVISPAVHVVTSLQAVAALKVLSGQRELVTPKLTMIDVWDGTFRQLDVSQLRSANQCPACVQGKRDWLHGDSTSQSVVLCGRNSVQITPGQSLKLSLDDLTAGWASLGTVMRNPFLARLTVTNPDYEITVFKDGRAIIQGTDDPTVARGLYARYVGN
ncbi:MAG: ThiF family adenylyltransferase [Planctomycetaceae bacterium]